jgi:hypothetical protein
MMASCIPKVTTRTERRLVIKFSSSLHPQLTDYPY